MEDIKLFVPVPRIPVSTYRLQFNHAFRFSDAKKIIPYLHELGITDIYASPYFKARKGSLHGYDIVDYLALNPDIGSEEEYNGMVDELKKRGMGQILDIVPNHMCIASRENRWWTDVLENGPGARYSSFFDINWDPVKRELKNRVLLPILGDQYGKVLENQELRLVFEDGAFFIQYYEQILPVMPQTYAYILRHRIEEIKKLLGEENAHFVELMSIITSIGHLPHYTEAGPEKVEERYREKEMIKRRLGELCRESPEINRFIDENVRAFNGTKGEPESFDLLDGLLREQVYRLSYWRVATDEINYRRFFDINELAAIRVEDERVFEEAHRLVFKLVGEGTVTGLRVDHPDGLYDPQAYFRVLQKKCYLHMRKVMDNQSDDTLAVKEYEWLLSSKPEMKPFYIIGEKILTRGEKMPEDWPIFSSTGYVFLNSLNGIFIEADSVKAIDGIYSRFTGIKSDFQEIVYEKKRLIMAVSMSSEVSRLAYLLGRMSEKDRHTRDFTLNSLKAAIEEAIALFPVYRTYVNPSGINEKDRKYIEVAISKAKRKNPAVSESVFEFLKDGLFLHCIGKCGYIEQMEWLDFAMRFQQITGPVMAKGVEDTAFYVYNRFVSLTEVGASPDRFGTALDAFHGQNIERMKEWPHALIATSTHDTKRSEDVKARINVLSEFPDEWRSNVFSWGRMNKRKKITVDNRLAPDRNEEYLLYQTLIGAWPDEEMDETGYEKFRGRIKEYMMKAIREAKVNSSWINLNTEYENAVISFLEKVMERSEGNRFLKEFDEFRRKVSCFGKLNSLSQTLLKITSPGVPDFYQGTEIWDFSLVDPDNRRSVDYDKRIEMLREIRAREADVGPSRLSRELLDKPDDGKVKLYLTLKTLNYRRENRKLFENGEYLPLEVVGIRAQNICAFARREENKTVIVIAPRFFTKFVNGYLPLGKEAWGDSFIKIPFDGNTRSFRNIFTAERINSVKDGDGIIIYLSEIFSNFTVALMESLSDTK